jgi:hypothetical protein
MANWHPIGTLMLPTLALAANRLPAAFRAAFNHAPRDVVLTEADPTIAACRSVSLVWVNPPR